MEKTLNLTQCSFAYSDNDFRLDNISLTIKPGRMYGIVGPNGSGKSTLLRIIAGIMGPQQGKICIGDHPIRQFSRRELAREIAFLPQYPAPSFDLKVREAVALGRYPYQPAFGFLTRHDEEIIVRVLRETECERFSERYLSTLSGGEVQRVMIASVLAQEPAFLLLDEPSSALDIHHKAHVFDLLWRLSRRSIAIAIVTHDLNMAAEFCDELILMADGGIVHQGSPFTVMSAATLSRVYQADLRIFKHPLTGTPMVSVAGERTNAIGSGAPPGENVNHQPD